MFMTGVHFQESMGKLEEERLMVFVKDFINFKVKQLCQVIFNDH